MSKPEEKETVRNLPGVRFVGNFQGKETYIRSCPTAVEVIYGTSTKKFQNLEQAQAFLLRLAFIRGV